MVVSLAVACMLLRSMSSFMRPPRSASASAPTAPSAPASVGVATPAKIEPSTTTISASGGSNARTTATARVPRPRASRSALGIAGAAAGETKATKTTYRAYMPDSISPGTSAPTNRSPTLIESWSASTTNTTLGGTIWPRVPDAAMTPVASSFE